MPGSFTQAARPAALALGAALAAAPAPDRLLEEAVGFAGVIGFLASGAPGFVLAAVRDGETAFTGFGEAVKGAGKAPDAGTMMRIGSISKAFCEHVLAALVADGALLGLDDGGPMDAMGLGWVIMPEGDHPLILQKSGGLQGMFAYVAIAPTRGVGAFAAMNAFDVDGFPAMVNAVNDLVAELAPR